MLKEDSQEAGMGDTSPNLPLGCARERYLEVGIISNPSKSLQKRGLKSCHHP